MQVFGKASFNPHMLFYFTLSLSLYVSLSLLLCQSPSFQ